MPFSAGAAAADDNDGFKISSPRAEEQSRNVAALFSSLRRMKRERGEGRRWWWLGIVKRVVPPPSGMDGTRPPLPAIGFVVLSVSSSLLSRSSSASPVFPREFLSLFCLSLVEDRREGWNNNYGGVRFEKGRMDELNGWMRFRNFVYKFISYVNFIFWQGNENVQWSKKRI